MALTKVKLVADGVIDVDHLAANHGITTTNIGEGTALYYTDARVQSYLTTNSYATESFVTTAVSDLVASAPSTLNTLNELAAALGDDPNFATTVTNSIAGKLSLTGGNVTGTIIASGGVNMNNTNITNVNHIIINDAGVNEGIEWSGGNGWKIYESPDNLTNAGGNLQFVTGSTRRMTLNTSGGLEITGNATVGGTLTSSLVSIEATAPILDFVDTNSFTDVNDRFRIRAAGDVGQIRWWDDSAATDSVLTTFYPDGNVSVLGQITSSGGRVTVLDAPGNTPKIVFQEAINDDAFIMEYNGVGSGSGNYVSFYSAVTGWAGLGTGFNYIPQNGRVGIGTNDPQTSLHLTGALSISDVGGANDVTLIQFTESDNYDQFSIKGDFAGTGVENKIKFTTDHGGGNILVMKGDGNVGIGEQNPQTKLHLTDTSTDFVALRIDNANTSDTGTETSEIRFLHYRSYVAGQNDAGSIIVGKEQAWDDSGDRKSFMSFSTRDGAAGVSERMRIDSSGNVGIGGSAGNGYRLELLGSSEAANTLGMTYVGVGAAAVKVNSSGALEFGVDAADGSTERMRIDSSGNVGIGTTTPYTNLYVQGAAPYITIANTTEDDGGILFTDYQAGANPLSSNSQAAAIKFSSSDNILRFFVNDINAQRMSIDTAGNIGAPSGSNIYNGSDRRLKKNISTINYGVNTVCNLNPVKFNWIDGFIESEKDKDMLGFIAQEVQEVLPEAVENFSNSSIVAGNETIDNPLRVNEKFIIPVLVKAIQELKAEINDLKDQLNG